jgi:hypothetical protein
MMWWWCCGDMRMWCAEIRGGDVMMWGKWWGCDAAWNITAPLHHHITPASPSSVFTWRFAPIITSSHHHITAHQRTVPSHHIDITHHITSPYHTSSSQHTITLTSPQHHIVAHHITSHHVTSSHLSSSSQHTIVPSYHIDITTSHRHITSSHHHTTQSPSSQHTIVSGATN